MEKILFFLLVALVGWWIVNMAGLDPFASPISGLEVSPLEMVVGILGAAVSCRFFLYSSWSR